MAARRGSWRGCRTDWTRFGGDSRSRCRQRRWRSCTARRAISPQTLEKSRELIAARHYTFPFLRDEGNALASRFNPLNPVPEDLKQIYLKFGIDLETSNGEGSRTLPAPGTYVIDGGGTIRYASVDADYTRRPEPEETLAALEAR